MRGDLSVTDEEYEAEGPGNKLEHGFCMLCIGCLAFPAMVFLLGYNEKRDVCDSRIINFAEQSAQELDCKISIAAAEGRIVFFSCELDASSYTTYYPQAFNNGNAGDLTDAFTFTGPVGEQTTLMCQCVEKKHDESTQVAGNVDGQPAYDYEMQWLSTLLDTSEYHSAPKTHACPGFQTGWHPSWPTNLDQGTDHISGRPAKAGNFVLGDELMKQILAEDSSDIHFAPSQFRNEASQGPGWTGSVMKKDLKYVGKGTFETCDVPSVGCIRLQYRTNTKNFASVLAMIGAGGQTENMTIPNSWGCGASEYSQLWTSMSAKTKQDIISSLHQKRHITTWLLRVIGIVGAWLGIYCCFGPLTAAIDICGDCLDVIPCCGECLERTFEGIAQPIVCLMSLGIGCGSAFCVIAIVWVAMRPLLGILLFALATCFCAVGICIRCMAQGQSERDYDETEEAALLESTFEA